MVKLICKKRKNSSFTKKKSLVRLIPGLGKFCAKEFCLKDEACTTLDDPKQPSHQPPKCNRETGRCVYSDIPDPKDKDKKKPEFIF